MADRDLLISPIDTTPEDRALILGDVYRPRRQSEFLLGMLRTLASGSATLFRFGENSPPHRLLRSVAIELELTSRSFSDAAVLAIRSAVYRAFHDEVLFPARGRATYARGYVLLALPFPSGQEMVIEQDEVFSTADGRTVRSLARVVWPAGETGVAIPVACDIPGSLGNLPPGAVVLHNQARASYLVSNPAPIAGGRDEEGDEEMYVRFQDFIRSFRTASRRAVLSAAMNAHLPDERPRDATLVLPWRIPNLNREMGHGYVVIDSGAGSASTAQLARAQMGIDQIIATGEEIQAISCSPFVVTPEFQAECVRGADLGAIERQIREEWNAQMQLTLIEDGSGRGTVDLYDLRARLDRIPGVITVHFISPLTDILVPVGARAVGGEARVRARYAT